LNQSLTGTLVTVSMKHLSSRTSTRVSVLTTEQTERRTEFTVTRIRTCVHITQSPHNGTATIHSHNVYDNAANISQEPLQKHPAFTDHNDLSAVKNLKKSSNRMTV